MAETVHIMRVIHHTDNAPINHDCDGCDYTSAISVMREEEARVVVEGIKDGLDTQCRRGTISSYILIATYEHIPYIWEA